MVPVASDTTLVEYWPGVLSSLSTQRGSHSSNLWDSALWSSMIRTSSSGGFPTLLEARP